MEMKMKREIQIGEGRVPRAEIEASAAWLLERIRSMSGLIGGDVVYYTYSGRSLSLRDGEPEENTSGTSRGVSVRTIAPDGRQGVAYGNDLSRESLAEIAEWSAANCRAAEPEEDIFLYDGRIDNGDAALELYDEVIDRGIARDECVRACREMTELARGADPRVVSVRAASWSSGVGESFYASTAGCAGWRIVTSASCGAAVVMSDGDVCEMGSYGKTKRFASELEPERYAAEAVSRTSRLIGGKPMRTSRCSLVFDNDTAASLVDELGDLFCASDVHKGRSMMKGRIGTSVAGACVTLVDDPRLRRGMASGSFDGEGVPTRRTTLIDAGVAKSYLYDLQYAKRDGVESTGSATRGLASLPDVCTSNLILMPGTRSREDMIAGVDDGLFVCELMGLHTIDPVSGDFSLGAKGLRIRGGKLCEPVAGVTIAGDLLDLLKHISAVGNDLEMCGSTGAPTILAEDITVAGI